MHDDEYDEFFTKKRLNLSGSVKRELLENKDDIETSSRQVDYDDDNEDYYTYEAK